MEMNALLALIFSLRLKKEREKNEDKTLQNENQVIYLLTIVWPW